MRTRVLFCVGLAALLGGCFEEAPVEKAEVVRPVRVMTISDAGAIRERAFSGQARATQELDLAFNVAGPLVSFPVNVGDEVQAGDAIASIDSDVFLAEAERLEAALARAEATLSNATNQLQRQQFLTDQGHQSPAALDRYTAAQREADADVKASRAALNRAMLDLDYATLRAPFTGVVTATYVDNFENVREKQAVVRLLDSSRIEMVINIPENLIRFIPAVRNIEVIFDAFPDRVLPATVKEIGKEASSTTRTYPVTLIMDQPEDVRILPGMAGRATGEADEAALRTVGAGGLRVPPSAVFDDLEAKKTFVWVVDAAANTVSRREVRIGALSDDGVTVIEGLSVGDMVVTAGVHYLRDGQKVKLLQS